MNQQAIFQGVLAPMLTPFDEEGMPDHKRFTTLGHQLIEQGCTGLAVFGTTGEALSLGLEERMRLLDALVEGGVDPGLLMPGVGLCAVPDTVTLIKHSLTNRCGGVLILPPFYYKAVSDEGLFRYFADVIEQTGDDRLKLYLYHIPPVAQVGFSLDLIEKLCEAYPEIMVGIKDSSGDWNNTKAIIENFPSLNVFAGSEVFLLETLRAGGAGCITATANVNARAIRALYDNWQTSEAEDIQANVTTTRQSIQAHPMIPMLKAMLALSKHDPAWKRVRSPLIEMDHETAINLQQELSLT